MKKFVVLFFTFIACTSCADENELLNSGRDSSIAPYLIESSENVTGQNGVGKKVFLIVRYVPGLSDDEKEAIRNADYPVFEIVEIKQTTCSDVEVWLIDPIGTVGGQPGVEPEEIEEGPEDYIGVEDAQFVVGNPPNQAGRSCVIL